MFDLVMETVDRPFRDKHVVPSMLSVATHIVVVGGIIGAALFLVTEGLPEVPDMMTFVAEMPLPPPPPPPPAPAPGPKPAQSSRPIATTGTLTFPVDVPTEIRAESGIDTGVEDGVLGGVEGGIPGGVIGGIVGGIMTDIPAPPLPPLIQKRTPVRVGGEIHTPQLLYRAEPVYPEVAVLAHVTGVVILEATVDERGEVTGVVVLRSRKMLDQAAIDAVKQWRYSPLRLNGEPRAFVLTVTVNFSID